MVAVTQRQRVGQAADLVEAVTVSSSPLPDPLEYMTRNQQGEPDWDAPSLYRYLAACPKQMVTVQLNEQDLRLQQANALIKLEHEIYYQGYRLVVPKGVPITVPLPIAEILHQANQPLRTYQAQERRQYIQDIGEGMGPLIESVGG